MKYSDPNNTHFVGCSDSRTHGISGAFSRRTFLKFTAGFSVIGLSTGRYTEECTIDNKITILPRSEKLLENARIILEISCRAKAGENLLILADDILIPYAPGLAEAALTLDVIPLIIDVRPYLGSVAYRKGGVLSPLKSAMESADIVIQNLADTWVPNRPDFGRLIGNPDYQDKALTSERRWVILQCNGMEKWDISPEEVAAIQKRTFWLEKLLQSAKKGRITTEKGTDFTFSIPGAMFTPVLGIVPLYGEVAVTPSLIGTSGTFVADGPSQRDIRPKHELDRKPLIIIIRDGRVTDMQGDAVQLKRLKDFIASGDPPADAIDEIGILTTTLKENDLY